MSRFWTVAVEDWNDEEYPVEISTEEAEVMQAEATELGNEILGEVDTVNAMIDKTDSLEDLAVVADSVEEATPQEVQLVQVAGDLATAGIEEVSGDDLVPAAESFVGGKIAVESITEQVKSIWQNIKRWLKEVWARVEKFFYNIFGAIPRLRKDVKGALERLEKIEDEGKVIGKDNKTFEITSGIAGLLVGSTPVKKDTDFIKALETSKSALSSVFKTTAIAKAGDKLAAAFDKFDPATPEAAAKSLDKVLTTTQDALDEMSSGLALKAVGISKWSDFDVLAQEGLLGGKALVGRVRKAGQRQTILEAAEKSRSFRLEFTSLANKEVKLPDSVKFETMSVSKMKDVLKAVEGLLDVLEDFHRGTGRKDLLKAKDKLVSASDKLESRFKTADDAKEREILPYARAMYKLNTMYTTVVSASTIQGYQLGLANVRTALLLVAKSAAQYKAQDK